MRRYSGVLRTLVVYAVPTRPGWSRLIATFVKVQGEGLSGAQSWGEHCLTGSVEGRGAATLGFGLLGVSVGLDSEGSDGAPMGKSHCTVSAPAAVSTAGQPKEGQPKEGQPKEGQPRKGPLDTDRGGPKASLPRLRGRGMLARFGRTWSGRLK